MARVRVGVALLVPEPVATEIDGLRRALGDGALGRMAAHVTLVPPVNVRDQELEVALEVLARAAAGVGPLELELGPVATFWPGTPVVYLAVGGPGAGALARLREAVFRAPLARPLTWPFTPHVTVCDEAAPERIEAAVGVLAGYRASVVVERAHLLKEGPGRVWAPVADVALGGPAVVGRGGLPLELSVSERAGPVAAAWAAATWAAYGRAEHGPDWAPDEPFAITARREDRLVGLAEGYVRGAACQLSGLVVGAAERGQGVGSHLLAAVEAMARERGCARARLLTRADGLARRFYRDRGWVATTALPDWRHGRDFVVMERRLTPPRSGGTP